MYRNMSSIFLYISTRNFFLNLPWIAIRWLLTFSKESINWQGQKEEEEEEEAHSRMLMEFSHPTPHSLIAVRTFFQPVNGKIMIRWPLWLPWMQHVMTSQQIPAEEDALNSFSVNQVKTLVMMLMRISAAGTSAGGGKLHCHFYSPACTVFTQEGDSPIFTFLLCFVVVAVVVVFVLCSDVSSFLYHNHMVCQQMTQCTNSKSVNVNLVQSVVIKLPQTQSWKLQ